MYSPISAQSTNTFLQNIAYHTVFDTLSKWNIGVFDVLAHFDFTGNEATKTFSFNNWSQNSTSYEWNFGDGSTSTTTGIHTYNDTGTYPVRLIAFDHCGRSDTTSQLIHINGANDINSIENKGVTIHPNPANADFTISDIPVSALNSRLEITDVQGRIISTYKILNQNLSIESITWAPGIYLLKLN